MKVEKIVNQPVPSNCYILEIDNSHQCVIVDPGSKSINLIVDYLEMKHLHPEFILLTHEHFDHIWGCNELMDKYDSKLVCSSKCAEKIAIPNNYYNRLYYDNEEYYAITNVYKTIEDLGGKMEYQGKSFFFYHTPGHSSSSICISVDNMLITGDTIMNGYKPLILKRHEGSKEEFEKSVRYIFHQFPPETLVLPGHGDIFALKEAKDFYKKIFAG